MIDQKDTKATILNMLQEKHPGYHPLISLAEIALNDDTPIKTQVDCHKTIVKYVESELKSVEVKADVNTDFGTLRVIIDSDDEDDLEIPTSVE